MSDLRDIDIEDLPELCYQQVWTPVDADREGCNNRLEHIVIIDPEEMKPIGRLHFGCPNKMRELGMQLMDEGQRRIHEENVLMPMIEEADI